MKKSDIGPQNNKQFYRINHGQKWFDSHNYFNKRHAEFSSIVTKSNLKLTN